LVLADERIVAILVPVGPENDEGEAEGWYLEVGFGPCEADGLLFASLPASETWVRKQLGDGLETQQASPSHAETSGDQAQGEASQSSARRLRILIVEDDGIQAMGLVTHLRGLGHEVVGMVASAPAAVAAAEEQRTDLVFMDVRLADGTNGIDAAARIQERLGIASIFMTAHADVQTRVRVAQVRAVELLPKPVSPASITAALHRAAQSLR